MRAPPPHIQRIARTGARARIALIMAMVVSIAALSWTALAGGTEPADTYWSTVEADSPTAQYRFSDAAESSTLADSAGSDTATNGGITLAGAGPFPGSKSGSFGGEAFATLASDPLEGASEFTAEAWVNWSGGASYNEPVFDFGQGATDHMYLTPASALSEHELAFAIQTSAESAAQVTAPELKADGWHFLAVTETSSGTLTLYLDGKQVGQVKEQTLSPASLGSVSSAYLGKSLAGAPDFHGSLSNVAFYRKALSAARIEAHFNAGEFPVDGTAPTISGAPEDEAELTAHAEDWMGLAPITFGYQWLRCNGSGEGCTNIGGAGEQDYAIAHEDVEHTLRVEVTGTNAAGQGSARSAPTSTVAPRSPTSTAPPTISGTAEAGQTLSASTGSWTGTPTIAYAYQWQRCDGAGENCEDIAGASEASYTGEAEDVGFRLRVLVTASNAAGSSSSASSASEAVEAVPPSSTTAPTITGAAEDSVTLSASTGAWSGTSPISYAYQWRRCDSAGEGCEDIAGANDATYTLASADIGATLRVKVTASNAGGSATESSDATALVKASAPVNLAAPTISGGAEEGRTLTAHAGTWRGTPTISYAHQWQSCDSLGESCLDIPGASGESYVLGVGDLGSTLRVRVSASNAQGSAEAISAVSETVTPPQPPELGYASEFGSEGSGDGQFLSPHGLAIDSTGEILVEDEAQNRVQVLGDGGEYLESFGSHGSGDGQLSQPWALAIDAERDVWVLDNGNERLVEFNNAREFQRNVSLPSRGSDIAVDGKGEVWVSTTEHGVLVYSHDGEYLRTVDAPGPEVESGSQPVALAASGGHVWTANWAGQVEELSEEGEHLAAFGSPGGGAGQLRAPDALAVSGGYVYVGEGDRVQQFDEEGHFIAELGPPGREPGELESVTGLAVDAAGNLWLADRGNERVQKWSPEAPGPPESLDRPSISGPTGVGVTLTAETGSWRGSPRRHYAFRWERCDSAGEDCAAIVGAGGLSYVPVEADFGHELRVTITASNSFGSASVVSWPTHAITTLAENVEAPSISGTAQAGLPLTGSEGTWTGEVLNYVYQWQRCSSSGEECADIELAWEEGYTPTEADVGHTLRVVVSAINEAGTASATSAASAVVIAGAPENETAPSVAGVAEEGQEVSADPGGWSGPSPVSGYTYQWQSCDALGESCLDIAGATSEGYVASAGDVGATLRVIVTATNAGGSTSSTSAPSPVVISSAPVDLGFAQQFGEAGSGEGQLESPSDLAVKSGHVWVLDSGNSRVAEFSESGELLRQFGSFGSGEGELEWPGGIALDDEGHVFVMDSGNERIDEFSQGGEVLRSFGEGLLGSARGIAVDRHGRVWVPDTAENRLLVFSGDGEVLKVIEPSGAGELNQPDAITIGANGHVWVADYGDDLLIQFNEDGERLSAFSPGDVEAPYAIALYSGHMFVGDLASDRVQEFGEDGELQADIGAYGSGPGEIAFPAGLAADSEKDLWIADGANDRIAEWAPETPGEPVNLSPPSISGTAGVGGTLSAAPGAWRGSPRPSFAYQWQRCNASGEECTEIEGANSESYEAQSADLDHTLRVTATATNIYGSASATSQPSDAIGMPPTNTTLPTISGTPEEGSPLSVDPGVWQGAEPISFSFDWQRCNALGEECEDIERESWGESYTPTTADVDHTLRVIVFASSGAGEAVATSLPSEVVFPDAAAENTEAPAISGVAQDEQTLSASTGAWRPKAALTYAYQWERCDVRGEECASIEGATGADYALHEADIGHKVRVTVTASNPAAAATASSEVSAVVVAVTPPANREAPRITGVAQEGHTVGVAPGAWSTPHPPLSYAYKWQRCDGAGESCSDIAEATSASYTLGSEDSSGDTLRVVVTATDSLSVSASATSDPRYIVAGARTTEYAYDANGNLESRTDGNGHSTTYEYGPENEQTKVSKPGGAINETGYDGDGLVTSQTDGNGQSTEYKRNVLGQVSEVVDPLSRKTKKEYDPAGNLTSVTDPSGRTTSYHYDPANRLLEKTYSDGTTQNVEYEYDPDGNKTKMVDGTGTSTYHYDELDRLSEASNGHGDRTGYEYDLAGDQTRITYPSGESVQRTFDADGRLESVKDWLGNVTSFAYDPNSNLTTISFPESTSETDHYAYDLANQMSEAKFAKGEETLASLSYGRDGEGQVAQSTSSGLPGEESTLSSYDAANRLTESGATAYEYDGAGNPTKIGSSTAAYDHASQLEHLGTTEYSFNEEGQRTKATPSSGPATSYGYDQAGNLTSVDRSTEGEAPAVEDSYAYDGEGLRSSSTSGATTKHLTWDQSGGLPLILSDGSYSFIYGPADTPIEQIDSEGHVSYLHHDQQGSVRMLSGEDGSVEGKSTYDAYGNLVEHAGSASSPLGYDGQYTEADTGLIYLRARSYDPKTAQSLSADPLVGFTREPYAYASADPLNESDPSGLCGFGSLSDFGDCFNPVSSGNLAYQGAVGLSNLTGGAINLPWLLTRPAIVDGVAVLDCATPTPVTEAACGPLITAAWSDQTASVVATGIATNWCNPGMLAAEETVNTALLGGGALSKYALGAATTQDATRVALTMMRSGPVATQGLLDVFAAQHQGG